MTNPLMTGGSEQVRFPKLSKLRDLIALFLFGLFATQELRDQFREGLDMLFEYEKAKLKVLTEFAEASNEQA